MANITSKRGHLIGAFLVVSEGIYDQHSREHGHRQAGRMVLEQ